MWIGSSFISPFRKGGFDFEVKRKETEAKGRDERQWGFLGGFSFVLFKRGRLNRNRYEGIKNLLSFTNGLRILTKGERERPTHFSESKRIPSQSTEMETHQGNSEMKEGIYEKCSSRKRARG